MQADDTDRETNGSFPAVASRRARRGVCLLFVLTVASILAGCRPSEPDVVRATREGRLILNIGADPEELDPHTTTGIPEFKVEMELFEGLVGEDPETGAAIPGAAESWKTSEDGRTWTFRLRPEARWSNGDPLTSADWVYSFRRALTPALGNTYGVLFDWIRGARDYRTGATTDFAEVGVRARGEHVLEIELIEPLSYFASMLVLHTFYPVHRPTIEKHGAIDTRGSGWTRPGSLVGNGPFVLVEWIHGQRLVARPNPHYWDADRVRLREVVFLTVESAETEERSFRAGQLHVTNSLPVSKIASYRDRRAPEFRNVPHLAVYYYMFNTSRPPFDDVRVRRALALALDRRAIVERVTQGGEEPALHFFPPTAGGYGPGPQLREDMEEARRLLAEAGYPDGRGFPVVSLLYNTHEAHRQIAEAVQQMWRVALGIEVRLVNQEWKVYLSTRRNGDYDLSRSGWVAPYDDVSCFAELMMSENGNNHTRWRNETYDALVRRAGSERDAAVRKELYRQADALLLEEMPVVPLYFYRKSHLVRPEVRGWYDNVLDHHPLRAVWLSGGDAAY
ncbi:peptide ABC transporter substrate-binding protein [Opitutales bacterium ASA1]|nr:peptide ABC transporter substrate-binding protein [Opitutales bacterium ASA1]